MEKLTINIPTNQEIDWQESAKQEKIVFKQKASKPKSWREYCNNTEYSTNGKTCSIFPCFNATNVFKTSIDR